MNRIIECFHQLCAEGNEAQELEFFREVQTGVYWIPVKYDKKETMQICMMKSARGRTYIPAFLNRESAGARRSLMKLNYPSLKKLAEQQSETVCGLVIDPYEEKIVIDRTLMQMMEKKRPAAEKKKAI